MKTIKFRAWHIEEKFMYDHVSGIDWTVAYGRWYGAGVGRGIFYLEPDFKGKTNNKLDSVLMQYTGLKDKNGKDIYEGDIIHYGYYENKDENGLELLDKPMNFKVWWEQSSCSWCSNGRLVIDNEIYPFEIIGNIYENPELLET